jgi:uncharacterized membrane protein YedE/YeeE
MVDARTRVGLAAAMAVLGAVLVYYSFEHALCLGTGQCSPHLLFALPGVALAVVAALLAYSVRRTRAAASD